MAFSKTEIDSELLRWKDNANGFHVLAFNAAFLKRRKKHIFNMRQSPFARWHQGDRMSL
jgi:hypothetical protein